MEDERFSVSGWEDDLSDVDKSRNPTVKQQRDILEAAENGDLELIKDLLSQDPNLINAIDKDKYTALHRACYNNHLEVVKYLVKSGASISAKTELQWEPLHSCCQWNHVECAAFLIQCGADVNAPSEGGQTPLHVAATHAKNYATVQLLLMHPYINPNLKNNSGETAADIARRSSKYYNIFDMVDPVLDNKNIDLTTCQKSKVKTSLFLDPKRGFYRQHIRESDTVMFHLPVANEYRTIESEEAIYKYVGFNIFPIRLYIW